METIELFEDNVTREDCANLPRYYGARALVMAGAQCIMVHNGTRNLFTLPGGRIEAQETALEAVHREVLEETGYRLKTALPRVRVVEYFSDSVWDNVFYWCEALGTPHERSLTDEEIAANLQVKSLPIIDVLDILQTHESHDPHAEAIHRRELIGVLHTFMTKSDAL